MAKHKKISSSKKVRKAISEDLGETPRRRRPSSQPTSNIGRAMAENLGRRPVSSGAKKKKSRSGVKKKPAKKKPSKLSNKKPSSKSKKKSKPSKKKPSHTKKKPSKRKEKKRRRKEHQRSNFNLFQKALSEYLKKSGIDWRRHGYSFGQICSIIWRDVKGHPLNYILDNVDQLYHTYFETKRDRNEDIVHIRREFTLTEWYFFRENLYYPLVLSEYVINADRIFFQGEDNIIESYDLSVRDFKESNFRNIELLWAALKMVMKDVKSPPPAIALAGEYTDGDIIIIVYKLFWDDTQRAIARRNQARSFKAEIIDPQKYFKEKGKEPAVPPPPPSEPEKPTAPPPPSAPPAIEKTAREREIEKEIELKKAEAEATREKTKLAEKVLELVKAGYTKEEINKILGL